MKEKKLFTLIMVTGVRLQNEYNLNYFCERFVFFWFFFCSIMLLSI